jgi:ribosomal protein L3 glutamine methyltransferase
MPAEFHAEPRMGLEAGEDGLDLVVQILLEAGAHLHEQGVLIVEVGNSGVALEQLFPQVPWTWVEFERGGHGVFVVDHVTLHTHQSLFRKEQERRISQQ